MNDENETNTSAINAEFIRMSGLEFLQKSISSGNHSPMTNLLNMRVLAVDSGKATIEGTPSEKFYNPMMRVHGGYLASLIDTALGCSVLTKLPAGVGAGTVNLSVHFVRKFDLSTGPLLATGTVLHAGRTILTAECHVTDRAGVLYGHGTGTFLVYPST